MSTLVALSDSHLGYRHKFKLQRLKDYASAFEEAVDGALSFNPDVVVFGGDLLHHTRPDPRSLKIVIQTLKKAAEKTQLVVCIGNHEIEGHLGTTYTPIYSEIHDNIHVLTTDEPHLGLKLGEQEAVFHGFQYIRNRELAEETLKKVTSEVEDGPLNILCIHQAVEKYLGPPELSLRALREAASRYDLILCGHVHKHQKIAEVFDVCPAYYVGSTERISFNEHANPNGFMVFKDYDFNSPQFVTVNSAPMRQVSAELGRASPSEVNDRVAELIRKNGDVSLLQVNVDVEVAGDLVDVRHDWELQDSGFTVLDVRVNPRLAEKAVSIEKPTLSEDLIREYFDKSGMADQKDLLNVCVEMYQKYGGQK